MKNFILFLAFVLIFISCEMQQVPPVPENADQTVLAKERQALDRWAKGDPYGFGDNFAEDATYFDDIGAHMRLDSLVEIKKYLKSLEGNIPPHKYELVDPKVQVYGNTAILTLRYHSTMENGEPGPPWKATSVYQFSDGNWRVVHAHWSLVKQP